ncbi:MAG: dehydrogenase [Planctomycetaceae bacterium]|nr:dehydrogenase [Planctomycetaceae bacterium]
MTATDSQDEFTPATVAELSRFMRENSTDGRRSIVPVGGRTALNYGHSTPEDSLRVSTAQLQRVIDYPARDMTITVEAGIRMDELAKTLKAENQRLPVDVAQSQRATLGGVIATNTSGPRRFGHGTMRDYVIGISGVDASGRHFKAGGRVVKNVAGYDLCKLMVGSLGTLAIITQVTLKLRPTVASSALVWMIFPKYASIDEVLESLLASQTRPISVEVLDPKAADHVSSDARCQLPNQSPVLIIGFEGSDSETQWQIETLEQECAEFKPAATHVLNRKDADSVWKSLTEYATWSDDPLTFQANLRPSKAIEFIERATKLGVAVQAHAGNGTVVGHLSDEASTLESCQSILDELRQIARASQGNLVVLRCDDDWKAALPVFGEPEDAWPLMQRVKAELDPNGILSPGKIWKGHQ